MELGREGVRNLAKTVQLEIPDSDLDVVALRLSSLLSLMDQIESDLGDEMVIFLDWMASAGMRLWQVLPLNPPGFGYSPYGCLSSFAGNPLLISPQRLLQEEMIPPHAADDVPPFADERVEFEEAARWIASRVDLFADDRQLGSPRIAGARVSLPSDTSFDSFEHAVAHVSGAPLSPDVDVATTQSLVDVMLVMLIIFMLVTPMLQKGVPVVLPEAGNTVDKPDTQTQTVVVKLTDDPFDWYAGGERYS